MAQKIEILSCVFMAITLERPADLDCVYIRSFFPTLSLSFFLSLWIKSIYTLLLTLYVHVHKQHFRPYTLKVYMDIYTYSLRPFSTTYFMFFLLNRTFVVFVYVPLSCKKEKEKKGNRTGNAFFLVRLHFPLALQSNFDTRTFLVR